MLLNRIVRHDAAKLRQWFAPVAFGIVEQAILSGVNFAFTAIMAHQLGPENFGWFSIAWAAMLFMEAGSQGLFGDSVPASARRLPDRMQPRFRGALLFLSLIYSLALLGLVLVLWGGACGLHLKHADLIPATALAFVGLRAQNAARRIYYLDGLRKEAALAAVVNATITLAGAAGIVWLLKSKSPVLAMMLIAVADSLAASVIFLQHKAVPLLRPTRKLLGWARARLWRTGRWLLASNSMSWLGNFGLVIIVGALLGVKASGQLRVVMTLTTPPAQIVIVLLSIIVPRMATKARIEATGRQWPIALKSMCLIGLITGCYALAMTVMGGWLPNRLFGASASGITSITVAIATFGYAMESVRYGCNVVFLSRGQTLIITIGQAASLLSAMLLVPIVSRFGFDWVVFAITASNNINTLFIFSFFLFLVRKSRSR